MLYFPSAIVPMLKIVEIRCAQRSRDARIHYFKWHSGVESLPFPTSLGELKVWRFAGNCMSRCENSRVSSFLPYRYTILDDFDCW